MAVEKFILKLEKEKLKPTMSQDEVEDIEKGVSGFVKLLTDEVAKEEKLFTVERILKVGSFYEKTKVGNPDEFDFLLELKLDGGFEIEKGCHHNPCSAHVKVGSSVCASETFMEKVISPAGHLVAVETYRQWRIKVAEVLQKALRNESSLNKFQCEMGHLFIVQKLLGAGPNAEIGLVWHKEEDEFEISIDLSICIPCTDELLEIWKSEFRPLDFAKMPRPVLIVPSPSRSKLRSCRYGVIIQGQSRSAGVCWKISTTPIEVFMLRNITQPYRLCYLFLKWICKLREKQSSSNSTDSMLTLSSYMIKNAVLFQASREREETIRCLEDLLQYLCVCASNGVLPAYFMPKVNLWRFKEHKAIPPCEILNLLTTFLFKTMNESNAESLSFREIRLKVFGLQRQFTDIEMDALERSMPKLLALEDMPQNTVLKS